MLQRTSRLLVRLPKARRPRERPWELFNSRDFGFHEGSQNYSMWVLTASVVTALLFFEVHQQWRRILARGNTCPACEAAREHYRKRLEGKEQEMLEMIEDHAEYGQDYYPKPLASSVLSLPKQGVKKSEWSPYTDNGGTTAAIAGKDYVILAGDTRLNGNFCVRTRHDDSKLFKLTNNTYMASNGMQADRLQLQQMIKYRIQWYRYNNGGKEPSTAAIAQLMSTLLYQRRFFPYYTFNMIVGLNAKGEGVCYSYDAIGSTEPFTYGTRGSAASFVEPLLDCLLRREHMQSQAPPELSADDALEILKNAFTGAAERDIFTGDAVTFFIITKDGVRSETLQLRKD